MPSSHTRSIGRSARGLLERDDVVGKALWYYHSLADTFCEKLPGQLSNELREIVEVLEAVG